MEDLTYVFINYSKGNLFLFKYFYTFIKVNSHSDNDYKGKKRIINEFYT